MHPPEVIEKCRNLRREGFTLGEIVKKTGVPKTTVYDHIHDIPISAELKQKIEEIQRKNRERIAKFGKERKKTVPKPNGWNLQLISFVAHFVFDGQIEKYTCVYNNRNVALIKQVRSLAREIFKLEPSSSRLRLRTGVHEVIYYSVELSDYIRRKSQKLKQYIKNASLAEKRIFLRAFYDDEGCARFSGHYRKVRGYQHNLEILKLVQILLKDFDIDSRIDEKYKEIVITRKENLIKFRDKINFSKGVFINPNRKNSIWKEKLEKREILERAINSYQN